MNSKIKIILLGAVLLIGGISFLNAQGYINVIGTNPGALPATPNLSDYVTPIPTHTLNATPNSIGKIKVTGWKTFSHPSLDATFQYPVQFNHMNLSAGPGAEGAYLSAGIQLEPCLNGRTNCNFYTMHVQAATADYVPSKGPADNLTSGFIKENGKYYYRTSHGGRGSEIVFPVREITAKNTTGIMIMLGENVYLGVFNLKSSADFMALNIYNPDARELSEADFMKVLKSVEVL